MNLLSNALKFTHHGDVALRVSLASEISTDPQQVNLHFEVRDTGIGIPENQQAHIFEPFKQGDGSTTRKYGGTGLGLSISTRLVEAMGGRIWVESEEGHGSTFHVALGVGLARPEAASRTTTAGALSLSLRVLVAEDNRINQRLAVAFLERDGHTVTVVDNGAAALAAARSHDFDAILMDVQMPVMSGLDATRAIRAHERTTGGHVPIIAMTAHAMQGDREACLAAGMDSYLSKPIALHRVRHALMEVTSLVELAS